jgi:hypothetical protein
MRIGKKVWIIPDCELPRAGEGILKGHESVIIVNDGDKKAEIKVSLYFTDGYVGDKITWTVEPKRVRCFRMNDIADMCGVAVPFETQYAMKIKSGAPIVVQYGRLDNRQTNLAYYTTLGYSKE